MQFCLQCPPTIPSVNSHALRPTPNVTYSMKPSLITSNS